MDWAATNRLHIQVDLIKHAVQQHQYHIQEHMTYHNITYETARTDLMRLAEAGLLKKGKFGKNYVFVPVNDLMVLLENQH